MARPRGFTARTPAHLSPANGAHPGDCSPVRADPRVCRPLGSGTWLIGIGAKIPAEPGQHGVPPGYPAARGWFSASHSGGPPGAGVVPVETAVTVALTRPTADHVHAAFLEQYPRFAAHASFAFRH